LVFISHCYHESHRGELFLKHSVQYISNVEGRSQTNIMMYGYERIGSSWRRRLIIMSVTVCHISLVKKLHMTTSGSEQEFLETAHRLTATVQM